jgi:hypothetical protein
MPKNPLFLIVTPKPQTMKRYVLILFLTAMSTAVMAQFDELLTGSVNDAKYLSEGYISPFMKAFGYGMNNGWYNSAAPHKLGGFDLTLTAAAVYVPVSDQSYFVDNNKMTSIERMSGSTVTAVPESGYVPTAFGADVSPNYRSPKGAPVTQRFSGPAGLGVNFLPTPALSLGIGLPKGFEIRARFVPTIDLHKNFEQYTGSFGMFGLGIMHDIKQWIPGVKNLPFDISAFVGYTKLNLDLGFDSSDPNRRGDFGCSATTIQALVGKKISILSVYGSVGYNIAKTDLALKGNYDFNDNGTIDAGEKDPFTLSTASNGVRGTIGLRIRLAVIAFHADYSIQKYRTITGGFGINFR